MYAKKENPAGGRGFSVAKRDEPNEKKLAGAGRDVKLRVLRWAITATSEIGMAASRWTDRLQILLDRVREGDNA